MYPRNSDPYFTREVSAEHPRQRSADAPPPSHTGRILRAERLRSGSNGSPITEIHWRAVTGNQGCHPSRT